MMLGDAASRTETRPASFRWKAFGIHLAISLLVLGALLYVLFYYWFPGYLFDTDGGWQALRVIAGVDIILGPLLTLIAANPTKSTAELRKDFTVIGVIQVCALSAGTWLAWDNRPWAMLWYDGMIYSLPWSALRDEPSALEGIARVGDSAMPQRVVVHLPRDPLLRGAIMEAAREKEISPLLDGTLYGPWAPRRALLQAFSDLSLEMTEGTRSELQQQLDEIRAHNGAAVLVPVRSRYHAYFLAIDAVSGNVIQRIDIEPSVRQLGGLYPSAWLEKLQAAESELE